MKIYCPLARKLTLFITGFLCVIFSNADMVYLKNGKIIEGQVKSSNNSTVLIDTPGGVVSMPKSMVDRIQRESKTTEYFNYTIEVSSVVKKEDAERTLNFLLAQGFNSAHMVYESPYYKVQVGPFTKEPEAIATAQSIDKLAVPYANSNKCQVVQSKQGDNNTSSTDSDTVESNIALAINGAKATADSEMTGYSSTKVIDGNTQDPNSRWVSRNTPGAHWLIIDFGEPKPFYRVSLFTGEEHDSRYILRDFTVQYWNGIEWADIGGVRNSLVENPVFNFSVVTSQRVRVYITSSNYMDNIARIFEVKVTSSQKREITALPTESRIKYDFDIVEPAFLKDANPELHCKAGEWYTLMMHLTYEIGTVSGLSAVINPDAQDFWNDTNFRDYLNLKPSDYGTSIAFDTKNNSDSQTITNLGELSFQLKSRAPQKTGRYFKKIRCNLYNPIDHGSQRTREIPFTLVVEDTTSTQ